MKKFFILIIISLVFVISCETASTEPSNQNDPDTNPSTQGDSSFIGTWQEENNSYTTVISPGTYQTTTTANGQILRGTWQAEGSSITFTDGSSGNSHVYEYRFSTDENTLYLTSPTYDITYIRL